MGDLPRCQSGCNTALINVVATHCCDLNAACRHCAIGSDELVLVVKDNGTQTLNDAESLRPVHANKVSDCEVSCCDQAWFGRKLSVHQHEMILRDNNFLLMLYSLDRDPNVVSITKVAFVVCHMSDANIAIQVHCQHGITLPKVLDIFQNDATISDVSRIHVEAWLVARNGRHGGIVLEAVRWPRAQASSHACGNASNIARPSRETRGVHSRTTRTSITDLGTSCQHEDNTKATDGHGNKVD